MGGWGLGISQEGWGKEGLVGGLVGEAIVTRVHLASWHVSRVLEFQDPLGISRALVSCRCFVCMESHCNGVPDFLQISIASYRAPFASTRGTSSEMRFPSSQEIASAVPVALLGVKPGSLPHHACSLERSEGSPPGRSYRKLFPSVFIGFYRLASFQPFLSFVSGLGSARMLGFFLEQGQIVNACN